MTTASRRLFNRDYLTMAIVQLRDPERSDAALEEVTALLRERHHIAKGALDDFTATSPRAVMTRVTRLGSTLATTVRGVGLLALFIGGVVITTLMGSAVFERRREVGVARAVGASRADILQQFLLEATLVAGLGGMVGIGLGVGSASLVARLLGAAPLVAWRTVAWAAAVSIGLGIAFGAYPAWRAARVDPADALRA